jgi:predicted transposase/invertase (TIGR01784 family)
LEIQVEDKKDYPERSLYYWAREYSSALKSGGKYKELPRVIIINILTFPLFNCNEYHSEFRPLEINRHTELCDKQVMHYYELPKLPDPADGEEEIKYWLAFFKAETEEDLDRIIETGVPFMNEAVTAYKSVARSNEFKEYERMREKARHNEASAIGYAVEVATKAAIKERDAEIIKHLRALGATDDYIEKALNGGAQ